MAKEHDKALSDKRAVIFGASGAVGRRLTELLVASSEFKNVTLVVRREIDFSDSKRLKQIAMEPLQLDKLKLNARGTDVFCCLGTTIKVAGSQQAFRAVDFDLVTQIARWANAQPVRSFHVVSSIAADETSGNFYLRTKGEMEARLIALRMRSLTIYRPSALTGAKRNKFRLGESIGILLSYPLRWLPFKWAKQFAPVDVSKVAESMIQHAISATPGVKIVESDAI